MRRLKRNKMTQKSNEKIPDQLEQMLDKQLTFLAQEKSPTRDLWPNIEAKLNNHETKAYNRRFAPLALAASLLISITAVGFSVHNLQEAKQLQAASQLWEQSKSTSSIEEQIQTMEQDYGLAKSVLLAQIGMNLANANDDLLIDVKTNLMIIEQATDELKATIIKRPEETRLLNLLNATYQQELVVLSQLARLKQES